ncbi:MAG: APC family permease [Eubacteriales bacterium]|nr:APC family permease [Eubacteriales bacterium]
MEKANKKGLSLVNLVAIAAGQVIGAGVVTLVGPAIGATGISAWLAYGVSVLMGFISIVPFIFLSSALVLQGGEYSIIERMLGEKFAGFYIVAYIAQCLGISLMGLSLGTYLNYIFPAIDKRLIAIVALTFFLAMNLMGVSVMAKLQTVLTTILIGCLLLFTAVGLTKIGPQTFDFSSPEFFTDGFKGFSSAVALYAFSTYGQYMVVNFGKDAENPKKNIPLAIMISSVIILIVYVGIALVNSGILPISETANKPLTVVAEKILPGPFLPLFIIGGPLMALATTVNSFYSARSNPLLRATRDGWFPEFFGKVNKNKVPFVLMGLIWIVGVVPILLNMSIKEITNNVVLVAYLLRMIIAIATLRLPKLYREQWEKSFIHLPDPVFYGITIFAILAQFYMVYLSARSLTPFMAATNIGFVVLCALYAVMRSKAGKVHIGSVAELK